MIAGKPYVGIRVDLWSCGVILYALLAGYLPFEDENTKKLYDKILSGDYEVPDYITSPAKDLIGNILNTDSEERFKFE